MTEEMVSAGLGESTKCEIGIVVGVVLMWIFSVLTLHAPPVLQMVFGGLAGVSFVVALISLFCSGIGAGGSES